MRPALSPDGQTLVFSAPARRRHRARRARSRASGAERIVAARRGQGSSRKASRRWTSGRLRVHAPTAVTSSCSHQGSVLKVALDSGDTQEIAFTRDCRADLRAAGDLAGAASTPAPCRRASCAGRPSPRTAVDRVRRVRPRLAAGDRRRQTVGRAEATDARRRIAAGARIRAGASLPDGRSIAYVTWSDAEGGHSGRRCRRRAAHRGELTRVTGPLRQPVVVAQGRPPRAHSRVGSRVPRPAARGRELLRDPLDRRERRRHEPRDHRDDGERDAVSPAGLLERRWHAPYLPQPRRSRRSPTDPLQNDSWSRFAWTAPIARRLSAPAGGRRSRAVARRPMGRVHLARQRVRHGAAGDPDERAAGRRRSRKAPCRSGGCRTTPAATSRWADNGKTITWALGDTFYRLPLADAMKFVREDRRPRTRRSDEAAKAGQPREGQGRQGEGEASWSPRPKAETITIALTMPRPAPQGSFCCAARAS